MQGEQRINGDDRRRVAFFQQGPERAHGIDLAEELQFELGAPLLVGRVGEGRHAPLARVVDENVDARTPCANGAREGHDIGLARDIAGPREHARLAMRGAQIARGVGETLGVAPADRDIGALRQQRARRGEADAR